MANKKISPKKPGAELQSKPATRVTKKAELSAKVAGSRVAGSRVAGSRVAGSRVT